MWASVVDGKEQCPGPVRGGKRHGYFALVKEGGVYLEDYDHGELKKRIKWRRDKLHVTCARCGLLFVPSANTSEEKFCRFHLSKPDYDGRYSCCGALHAVNPRGCATSTHVEPELEGTAAVGVHLAALDLKGAHVFFCAFATGRSRRWTKLVRAYSPATTICYCYSTLGTYQPIGMLTCRVGVAMGK
ncbi:unnamed protein product [Durusdinium trenchii]|uniref:Uncharacterized protein n=1 Tax=Durusdinium trenchii TaxID=1381693 RepID=A0ABP0PPN7_9DINO